MTASAAVPHRSSESGFDHERFFSGFERGDDPLENLQLSKAQSWLVALAAGLVHARRETGG